MTSKKKQDEFVVPDAIDPFIGYRAWEIKNGLLRSVVTTGHKAIWMPNVRMEAQCTKNSSHQEPPVDTCSCGIYAAATFDHLVEQRYQEFLLEGPITIAGTVYLWGKVVPASQGYRAQFAYPKTLWVPHVFWREGGEMAKLYNTKIKFVDTLVTREE